MNTGPSIPHSNPEGEDVIDLVIDGAGDRTSRPSTGRSRELGLREREKLVRAGLLPPLPAAEQEHESTKDDKTTP